jgi:SAM-dependent methyltransferase
MADALSNPGALLDISGSYWKTCTLHAGVELDLFTLLDSQPFTAAEVAGAIGGDLRATRMLLNALAAMGLLTQRALRFQCTPPAARWLSRNSEGYVGYIIRHHQQLLPSWVRLSEAVVSGRPVRRRSVVQDDQARENFLMGMFNLAMGLAPRIVPRIDLAGRRRLLDLGGGPGTYAIHFCRHNPGLKATVFDLPTSRPFAERTIGRFELGDRVDFHAGDYLSDALPGRFDVAWLSHILHGEGPETARRILAKAAAALEPGGLLIVHDFILDDSLDRPLFPALFSLNMLLGTESGQAYGEGQLREMLEAAGLRGIARLAIESPNESSLLVGSV